MNKAIDDRAGGIVELSRAHRQRRYMVLFYSLLLTMVAVPALGVLGIDPGFIELFLAANLLIAVFPLGTKRAVGYGDIVPRTDVARGLAIVEGVGGQLFLAVLIAPLVSLYATGKEAN